MAGDLSFFMCQDIMMHSMHESGIDPTDWQKIKEFNTD